ncbi:MAG: PD-(D/E)XK nuclease family transposase [Pirellulaceae bacterium]
MFVAGFGGAVVECRDAGVGVYGGDPSDSCTTLATWPSISLKPGRTTPRSIRRFRFAWPPVVSRHRAGSPSVFQLIDRRSNRELVNAIEVHTVELTKYALDESTIASASKLDQWAFFLLFGHQYDAGELRRLLPGVEFDQAIETLAIISAKTEDREMYDQREKAQRDYEWALSGAREEGLEMGLAKGREAGRVEGREEGREQGFLAGRIQTLQEILGVTVTTEDELLAQSRDELTTTLADLQQRLRDRAN